MNQKMSSRWRVAATRTDDGKHVGFAVYDTQDGRAPEIVSLSEDRARATHVAHAFASFDALRLGQWVPQRIFIRSAERGPVQ